MSPLSGISKDSLPPFVGVVTFNPMATLRFELLEQTVRSIEKAFPTGELFLLDNLSDDGSQAAVGEMLGELGVRCSECGTRMRGRWHVPQPQRASLCKVPPDNRTPGAGRARLLAAQMEHFPSRSLDVVWNVLQYYPSGPETYQGEPVVLPSFFAWSDDDMVWRPGAQATLSKFWDAAPTCIHHPDRVRILSGLLEPVWHWNTPRRTVEHGGVRVLLRDSAPGAAWTFRGAPIRLLRPGTIEVPGDELWRFGYDYQMCRTMPEGVAQIDLAEHIGWGFSTHGNEANEAPETKPLDREKWGV